MLTTREALSHCARAGCLQDAQLPADHFGEQRPSVQVLSDRVIRAEVGIHQWLYCFIEDSRGSWAAVGEAGYTAGFRGWGRVWTSGFGSV